MSVTFIEDNPNPSAIPYRLDGASFMSGLGTVVLSRSSRNLDEVSPLASSLFGTIQDLAHVHMVSKDSGDLITLSGHSNKWMDQATAMLDAEEIFEREVGSGGALIREDMVRRHIDVLPNYKPDTADTGYEAGSQPDSLFRKLIGLTKTTFEKAVTPVLEKDGGAIEIEGMSIDFQTGAINVNTVLVASCFGCGGQETTLGNAFNALQLALEGVKKGNTNAAVIQRLHYKGIESRDAPMGYALEKK